MVMLNGHLRTVLCRINGSACFFVVQAWILLSLMTGYVGRVAWASLASTRAAVLTLPSLARSDPLITAYECR